MFAPVPALCLWSSQHIYHLSVYLPRHICLYPSISMQKKIHEKEDKLFGRGKGDEGEERDVEEGIGNMITCTCY